MGVRDNQGFSNEVSLPTNLAIDCDKFDVVRGGAAPLHFFDLYNFAGLTLQWDLIIKKSEFKYRQGSIPKVTHQSSTRNQNCIYICWYLFTFSRLSATARVTILCPL